MPRYRLDIEYDGTPFYGWQRQENFISVQEVLEEVIQEFTHENVTAFAAGRTDTGIGSHCGRVTGQRDERAGRSGKATRRPDIDDNWHVRGDDDLNDFLGQIDAAARCI